MQKPRGENDAWQPSLEIQTSAQFCIRQLMAFGSVFWEMGFCEIDGLN